MEDRKELEERLKEIRKEELTAFQGKLQELLEEYQVSLIPEFTYIDQQLITKISIVDKS